VDRIRATLESFCSNVCVRWMNNVHVTNERNEQVNRNIIEPISTVMQSKERKRESLVYCLFKMRQKKIKTEKWFSAGIRTIYSCWYREQQQITTNAWITPRKNNPNYSIVSSNKSILTRNPSEKS